MGLADALSDTHTLPPGIAAELAREGGRITFARFMELALTHPEEGYYVTADRLLGHRGDFTTAPRRSAPFNRAMTRLLTDLVDAARADDPAEGPVAVIELGGGEGDLAAAILGEWNVHRPDLRDVVIYSIIEIGPELQKRQALVLSELMERGWRVRWGATLSSLSAGSGADIRSAIIFGNEFVDALPVHLVDVSGPAAREAWVKMVGVPGLGETGGEAATGSAAERGATTGGALVGNAAVRSSLPCGIVEEWGELSSPAEDELRSLHGSTDAVALRSLTRDGVIELRPAVRSLLAEAASVARGVCVVTVDYGDWPAGTHDAGGCGSCCEPPPLHGRTVRGYFKHQPTGDPYARAGRQDLTADVDFRALDLHGTESGFETVLFLTLAAFLQGAGAEKELFHLRQEAVGSLDADRDAAVLAALLDPEDVGGAFKVMLQVKE